jgi:hypothetical protein
MVGLNMTSIKDRFWLMIPFMTIVFGFLFFSFRFSMRHRRFIHFRFAMLSGVRGFVQALVFVGGVALLVPNWFVNASIKNSYSWNVAITVWLVMSLLVTFWLFTNSRRS